MTSRTHTTMNELVELATLDAFGLLPAADAVKFEQAFMTASSEVQAEIRSIQADLATDTTLLNGEEPSASLRQRVLDAVALNIESEAERLAPLATIGDKDHHIRSNQMASSPEHRTSGLFASVWTWRMAALVMFGVVVTLAVFNATSNREATMLASTYTTLNTLDELEDQFGPQFTEFVNNPNCRQYYLGAVDGTGMIRVAVNERTGNAFVLGLDLDDNTAGSQLRLSSTDGSHETLAVIHPKEGFVGLSIDTIDTGLFAAGSFDRLELISPDGKILFRSV
ncbi:MAG: hypothetical protein P8I74_07770 [Phycisphaerales bacterium]|nr:hypothetical protein [Phycisphaerales bacterium]